MKIVAGILLSLGLFSCASVDLKPGAANIAISRKLPESGYKRLADVQCRYGENLATAKGNVERCHNQLRNQALESSADLIVVESESIGDDCGNCVAMAGSAYKKL